MLPGPVARPFAGRQTRELPDEPDRVCQVVQADPFSGLALDFGDVRIPATAGLEVAADHRREVPPCAATLALPRRSS